MENELHFQMKKKAPSAYRSESNGFKQTTGTSSKGFSKPSLNLDPKKCNTNSKFDDIPDVHRENDTPNSKKMPPKPKATKPNFRKDAKEEKPLTDKLTNIMVDGKSNTAQTVERRIERLHTDKKEVTQKPNFAFYQTGQGKPVSSGNIE